MRTIKWFFSDKYIRIRIGKTRSTHRRIPAGDPRGSEFSPLMSTSRKKRTFGITLKSTHIPSNGATQLNILGVKSTRNFAVCIRSHPPETKYLGKENQTSTPSFEAYPCTPSQYGALLNDIVWIASTASPQSISSQLSMRRTFKPR